MSHPKAEALEEFAAFIESPRYPGLDSFTLAQVAAEARHHAASIRSIK